MRTKIYTTKKLERVVKKLIRTERDDDSGTLGKWNATLFFIDRKKCFLFTNGPTKYNVILTDVKAAGLSQIGKMFKNSLYDQLAYDGILMGFELLDSIIGELDFLPTDNDRSTTAFQNQRLYELNWWKYNFEKLENMPIMDLANRMNTSPIHIGKGRKTSDYTNSLEEIKKILLDL